MLALDASPRVKNVKSIFVSGKLERLNEKTTVEEMISLKHETYIMKLMKHKMLNMKVIKK